MPYLNLFENQALCDALAQQKIEPTDDVLLVSIGEKKLLHFHQDKLYQSYTCASSLRPPSCVEDSLGTPLGLHRIHCKIGDGAAPGMVFIGRESTGQCYWEREDAGPDQKMYVTTRILWLEGLEPGRNAGPGVDTRNRYIYIHGTCHPEHFPENLSAGCITLLDDDLIALFATVPQGSLVWIER